MAEPRRKRRWQDSAQAICAALSSSQVEDLKFDKARQWRQLIQSMGGLFLLMLSFGLAVALITNTCAWLGLGMLGVVPGVVGLFALFFYLFIRRVSAQASAIGPYQDEQRYQLPANLLQLLESELQGTAVVLHMDSNASYDPAYRERTGTPFMFKFSHTWLSLYMRVGKIYSVSLQIQRSGEYTGNFARFRCRYADLVTIKVRAPETISQPPAFPPFAGFTSTRMRLQGRLLVLKANTPALKRKLNRQGLATSTADIQAIQLLALLQAAFYCIRRQP